MPMQQQVADLNEVGIPGKLLDRVSPVHQNAFFTIDKGYVRFTTTRRDKARVVSKCTLLLVQTRYVDDVRSDRTGVYG